MGPDTTPPSMGTCPQCRKPAARRENPWRPFCSRQCKLVDFGDWLDEFGLESAEESEPESAHPDSLRSEH